MRPDVKSGDLLAWTHRAWGSWYDLQIQLVRAFTRSEYCHVGVAWRVADRVFALEAVSAGVRIFPLSRLLPLWWTPLKAVWTPEAEAWALAQVGEPYSKWQAVLAGLGLLKAGDDSIWQCAEYAQAALAHAGVSLVCDATPTGVMYAAQQLPGVATRLVEP